MADKSPSKELRDKLYGRYSRLAENGKVSVAFNDYYKAAMALLTYEAISGEILNQLNDR